MTRLMGVVLGVSFQTELLVMTLLGLANSTLDWKPFELISRLNLIKELNFSDDNIQFSNTFSERIRNLLTVTVVVEFFCGLLNPLTYLLKLYPIITWSRSNLLLPWLLTHALNTILPKMLSVSLVFVFYKANKISTLSLLEFVVVESINLAIASYNWYVFFAFYLNLREVEKNRRLRIISEEEIIEGPDSLSQSYSIPDLQEIFREPVVPVIRSARSLTGIVGNDSQELDDDSSPTLLFEENLSPAEMSMRILNLTPEDLEGAKREKNYNPKESDSSVETHKPACSCSSSSSDENSAFFISKKLQTRKDPSNDDVAAIEIHSRPRTQLNPSNSLNRSTQITMRKSAIFECPLVLSRSNVNDNLYFLLGKNIELLDKMCRTISSKNRNVPKDSMEKWLIFQHELECNLHRHVLSRESKSVSKHDHGKMKSNEFASFSASNRILSRNTYAYRADVSPTRVTRTSVLKSIKSTKNGDGTKVKELWNLKKYNDFTLEQDRREMYEKSKKSKMTSYRNVVEVKKRDEKLRSRDKAMKKHEVIMKKVSLKSLVSREKVQRPNLLSTKNLPKKLSYLSQRNKTNIKELIKKINWSINLRIYKNLFPTKPTSFQYPKTIRQESSDRIDTFEDETLSELQNAFSHSDDNSRGFQLGPEPNQPYPIFQIVAQTLAEIVKGWRELFHQSDTSELDFPMSDDVIFCGTDETSPEDTEWAEIERRKVESASLVAQLEQLLDTSRETLSAIETTRNVDKPQDVLRHYFERLQSDEIAQTIANWATESVDSLDSLDFPRSTLKVTAMASFSDQSEMEEFPPN